MSTIIVLAQYTAVVIVIVVVLRIAALKIVMSQQFIYSWQIVCIQVKTLYSKINVTRKQKRTQVNYR